MGLDTVRKYFQDLGMEDKILIIDESTATVEEAANALGCELARIAKTMSFLVNDEPILILTLGDRKIDNRKYKDYFHVKAKMIPTNLVEELIGHDIGGVCPFGVKDNVKTYLDISLKEYDIVYPAAGNKHSAVKLTINELEKFSNAMAWIDVCK